jgi:hypothetical protein
MCGSLTKDGGMTSPSKDDIVLIITDFLLAQKTEPWMAERLARKLYRIFGYTAVKVTTDFFAKGWDASDLFHWLLNAPTLKKLNPAWAASYDHVFFIEDLLQEAGLSKKTAHSLVITQAWMFNIPPVTLQFSVETLIRLGYREDVIKSIANNMPHLFHMLPEHIVHECDFATTNQRGLLWNAFLRLDGVDVTPAPPPINPRTGRVRKQTPKPPKATEVNQKPATQVRPESNSVIVAPYSAIAGDEVRQEVDALPKPAELPPLKLFNPLSENAPPKASEPPPEDPEEGPMSIFPGALPMPSLASMPKENPKDDKAIHSLLDLKRFQAIVEAATPEDEDECWEKYLEANPWLTNPRSQEYKVCVAILRWVPLNHFPTSNNLQDDTDAGRRTRFWNAILVKEELRPLLTLQIEVLEIRFLCLAPDWHGTLSEIQAGFSESGKAARKLNSGIVAMKLKRAVRDLILSRISTCYLSRIAKSSYDG